MSIGFNTPNRIIRTAMVNAGKLQPGDDPSSQDFADNFDRLNDMLNIWQVDGLRLWLQFDQPITPVANKQTYTLGLGGDVNISKPTRVSNGGYYLESGGTSQRPLIPLSWQEWTNLSNRSTTGPVTQYFVDKQPSFLNISFWLIPDVQAATGTIHLIIQQQQPTPTLLTDNMVLPQEWFMAAHWGLADEISTGQPQSIMDRCQSRAAFYKEKLDNWDVEDASTFFQPDSRSQYSANRFT